MECAGLFVVFVVAHVLHGEVSKRHALGKDLGLYAKEAQAGFELVGLLSVSSISVSRIATPCCGTNMSDPAYEKTRAALTERASAT